MNELMKELLERLEYWIEQSMIYKKKAQDYYERLVSAEETLKKLEVKNGTKH
jgi:bifunctional DNase/RNase